MNTWVKVAIGIVAVVVVLIAAALAVLRLSVHPNAYRARIDAAVTDAIGRDVDIDGPIRLSLLPWPSVRFGSVTIANADGFGDRPLARIHNGHVTLRVLPLFTGHLRLGTLNINGLDLALVRHGDGRTNWQSIVHRLTAATPAPERGPHAVKNRAARPEQLPLPSLKISALEISGADIRYDDAAHARHYRLHDASLETGRISNGSPFRLEATGDLSWPGSGFTAAVYMVSRIEPNIADHFYRFSGLSVNVLARGPAVPGGEQEANLGASGNLDLQSGRFALDNVSLQSAGLSMTGNIDGTGLNDRLTYNGRITVAEFSPRSVLQQLELHPPETQAGSALSTASFDAQFEGGAHGVRFKQIAAKLDQSTLSGSVEVHDFADPHYNFDLNLDTLNIDHYLPPGSAAQAQTSQPARAGGGAAQKAAEFDLAPLHHLRMRGRLRVSSLIVANLEVRDAVARVSSENSVLRVAPLTADLYGGSLRLAGAVDAGGGEPQYTLSGRLRGVAVEPLLVDTAGSHRLEGDADADIDLHAIGRQVAELKRSLSGSARLALDHGRINGFDLAGLLLAARESGDGASRNDVEDEGATAFRRLGGRFVIDNGMISSRDFSIHGAAFTGHGRGSYSLPDNRLDYTLMLNIAAGADQRLAPLAGLSVSMRVQGPLLAPSYTLDMRRARKPTARPAGAAG
ncbi:AsmA family protein [Salinisphaera sp.]|uniref:AsmA family protein n=1 Tax=Salinisphaera sp. TaxID=1914330 RepID=UPI002D780839|nr:AsmA family protein [Salinisphaera sp.]HET7312992.1 AsmA family protein [Salinisphaera sp.]